MYPENLKQTSVEDRALDLKTRLRGKIGQRILLNGDTLGTIVSEDFILTENGIELPMVGYVQIKGRAVEYIEENLMIDPGSKLVSAGYRSWIEVPNSYVFIGDSEINLLIERNNHVLNSDINLLESGLRNAEH